MMYTTLEVSKILMSCHTPEEVKKSAIAFRKIMSDEKNFEIYETVRKFSLMRIIEVSKTK